MPAVVEVEVGQVDARLDCEHDAGDQAAPILGFDVIDVDTVPMGCRSQAVTGAVKDSFAESGVCDYGTDGVVDFVAVKGFAGFKCLADDCDGGIAGLGDDGKDAAGGWGRVRAAVGCPGDVGVAVVGIVFLFGPQVDQEHVAASNGAVLLRGGRVVGEGGVAIDGHDWVVVPSEIGGAKLLDKELLDVVLGDLLLLAQGLGDEGECGVFGRQHVGGGAAVGLHLPGSEHCLHELHEVGAADDGGAGIGAYHFHGAGIDIADVGDGAVGAIFHGDLAGSALRQDCAQLLLQLLPADVVVLWAGHVGGYSAECSLFDGVDQPLGFAFGRDPEKPAPGSGGLEAGDRGGDRILAAKVVEQPAGDAVFVQVVADSLQLHVRSRSLASGRVSGCCAVTGGLEATVQGMPTLFHEVAFRANLGVLSELAVGWLLLWKTDRNWTLRHLACK